MDFIPRIYISFEKIIKVASCELSNSNDGLSVISPIRRLECGTVNETRGILDRDHHAATSFRSPAISASSCFNSASISSSGRGGTYL